MSLLTALKECHRDLAIKVMSGVKFGCKKTSAAGTAIAIKVLDFDVAIANKVISGWKKTPTAAKVAGLGTMVIATVIGATVLGLYLSGNLHTATQATRDFFAQSVNTKVWEIATAGAGLTGLAALGGVLGVKAHHKHAPDDRDFID